MFEIFEVLERERENPGGRGKDPLPPLPTPMAVRLHHFTFEIKKFLSATLTFFACEVSCKNKFCKILR